MRTTVCRSLFSKRWILTLAALLLASGPATADVSGLNAEALAELRAAGVDKYLGRSESTRTEHGALRPGTGRPVFSPASEIPPAKRQRSSQT